jgi:hypothetical protein
MTRSFAALSVFASVVLLPTVRSQDLSSLPVDRTQPSSRADTDWLLDPSPFRTQVARSADDRELVLTNGLIRRAWRIAPNAACVGFDDLVRGESLLRAVQPEATLTVDGRTRAVGGLVGQPDHAYLDPSALDAMTADPTSFRFTGFSMGPIEPRVAWKRVRHAAPDAVWPPAGLRLTLEFVEPRDAASASHPDTPPLASELGRELLFGTTFDDLEGWQAHAAPDSTIQNEGKAGEILAPANAACFVERPLPEGTRLVELELDAGTDRSKSWGPGMAVRFQDRVLKFHLRPAGNAYDSTAMFGAFDGRQEDAAFGGRVSLDLTKPWTLRLRFDAEEAVAEARPAGGDWRRVGTFRTAGLGAPLAVRAGKLDVEGGASTHAEPGPLFRSRLIALRAFGEFSAPTASSTSEPLRVHVHYAMYDGIPALSKWVEVHNDGDTIRTVDGFESEILAAVEHASFVELRDGVPIPAPQHLHVETDFAFGGFNHENANRHVVHWRTDPSYRTQVNYLRQTPCLLSVSPTYGPAQVIPASGSFETFRTFELAYDSLDRERRSLALRRLYRTVAPWVTENPLMMHMRDAEPDRVRAALAQCANVGFEMLILSFGSGFDMENDDLAYLTKWRGITEEARSMGIEIGSYSLLSSRRIGGGNDIVPPEGVPMTHGACPSLTSPWGIRYMDKLRRFFPATGFTLLEHDGPYPGDVDVTPRPPLQQGIDDSRWVQWRITTDFYGWCRSQGIYVNAPDHYFLNGTSKVGMGYREVNWSLPRDQQVIHTRQNIYDGTWRKTPSMGWMFVPLTEYHGGGAAATIEPLAQHLDHYDRMLTSNLALGVQACYRGPRLYDTEETRYLVAERVAWFHRYRDILEADVVHGRRADGRDVDWMLHVHPGLDERGMLVVFNPLPFAVERELGVDLYYTGLASRAEVSVEDEAPSTVTLDATGRASIRVTVPARGFTWAVIRAAD